VESPIHKSRRREHLTDKGGIWNFVLSFFFFFLELKSWVLYLSYTTILRFLAAYENLVSEEEEEQRSRNLPNKPNNSPAELPTGLDIRWTGISLHLVWVHALFTILIFSFRVLERWTIGPLIQVGSAIERWHRYVHQIRQAQPFLHFFS